MATLTVPPVLLIIYNRPGLTVNVMEALRVAAPSRLYIAADGPRAADPGDHDRCRLARTVVGTISAWALLMKSVASPMGTSGFRLKKMVTLVN